LATKKCHSVWRIVFLFDAPSVFVYLVSMKVNVAIQKTLHAEMKDICERDGYSVQGFTARAIRAEIDKAGGTVRHKVKNMTRKAKGAL
jgi:hypothetical protein